MKTIIAGSRSIDDYDAVLEAIERVPWEITEVVSGCALGVDRGGIWWAVANGIDVDPFLIGPHMRELLNDGVHAAIAKKRAGPRRNEVMAEHADALIAVWDGNSNGTADMIRRAKNHGLKVSIYNPFQERAQEALL